MFRRRLQQKLASNKNKSCRLEHCGGSCQIPSIEANFSGMEGLLLTSSPWAWPRSPTIRLTDSLIKLEASGHGAFQQEATNGLPLDENRASQRAWALPTAA